MDRGVSDGDAPGNGASGTAARASASRRARRAGSSTGSEAPRRSAQKSAKASANGSRSACRMTSDARAVARTSCSLPRSSAARARRKRRERSASTWTPARRSSRGRTRRFFVTSSAGNGRLLEKAWQRGLADVAQILLVLEEHAERPVEDVAVELARLERDERERPIQGLGHAGPFEQVVAAQRLDDRDDGAREPVRHLGEAPRDDRELALRRRVLDPVVEAAALQRVVHFARAVRGDDDRRRHLRLERAELGDRDLEIGKELEEIGLELLVRAVDLVDEEHGRLPFRRDNLEERPLDEELLAVDAAAGGRGLAGGLQKPDLEDLARVIPLVHGRRQVEALVALEPDESPPQGGGEHLRDLGLADAGLALEEEWLPEAERQEQRRSESTVGDVALARERLGDLVDRGERAHAEASSLVLMQANTCCVILSAAPCMSRAPTLAIRPEMSTSLAQRMVVRPSCAARSMVLRISTALPGACPRASTPACSGSRRSVNSTFMAKTPLIGPTPARTTTLKCVGSARSRLCRSGAHAVTCRGSVKKAHTRSRGAAMSSVPPKRIPPYV